MTKYTKQDRDSAILSNPKAYLANWKKRHPELYKQEKAGIEYFEKTGYIPTRNKRLMKKLAIA